MDKLKGIARKGGELAGQAEHAVEGTIGEKGTQIAKGMAVGIVTKPVAGYMVAGSVAATGLKAADSKFGLADKAGAVYGAKTGRDTSADKAKAMGAFGKVKGAAMELKNEATAGHADGKK